jgi:RNA polymerase-binding transcription factor
MVMRMPTTLRVRKDPFRKLLLKKRDELIPSGRHGTLTDSVQSPDAVEFAVKTLEQDVTAATLEMRAQMIKEIDHALQRVKSGTYGECEDCGSEINPNRLKAIPWARYCVPCQETRSRN